VSNATRKMLVGPRAGLTAVAVVATDQATKALSHQRALLNPETLLGIVPTGAATTTLAATIGLLAVSTWAVAWQVSAGRCPGWLAAIPLAAAASNVIDRLLHGAVIDWIPVGGYVVNLADIAIVVGAGAVALAVRFKYATSSHQRQPLERAPTTTYTPAAR
jgi:lipoprotein signal peptidase